MAAETKSIKAWIPGMRCLECRAAFVFNEDMTYVRHFENHCQYAGKNYEVPTLTLVEAEEVKNAVGSE